MATIIMDSAMVVINAKLAINADHRFAFSILATQSASWLRKELSSEVDSAIAAVRALSADSSYGHVDLTQLFRVAAHEAKKSRAQSRIFRVEDMLDRRVTENMALNRISKNKNFTEIGSTAKWVKRSGCLGSTLAVMKKSSKFLPEKHTP